MFGEIDKLDYCKRVRAKSEKEPFRLFYRKGQMGIYTVDTVDSEHNIIPLGEGKGKIATFFDEKLKLANDKIADICELDKQAWKSLEDVEKECEKMIETIKENCDKQVNTLILQIVLVGFDTTAPCLHHICSLL